VAPALSLNNAQAWDFPQLVFETEAVSLIERRQWQQHLATLDTGILSLMGEHRFQMETSPHAKARSHAPLRLFLGRFKACNAVRTLPDRPVQAERPEPPVFVRAASLRTLSRG
jgi:hypothetical protein